MAHFRRVRCQHLAFYQFCQAVSFGQILKELDFVQKIFKARGFNQLATVTGALHQLLQKYLDLSQTPLERSLRDSAYLELSYLLIRGLQACYKALKPCWANPAFGSTLDQAHKQMAAASRYLADTLGKSVARVKNLAHLACPLKI